MQLQVSATATEPCDRWQERCMDCRAINIFGAAPPRRNPPVGVWDSAGPSRRRGSTGTLANTLTPQPPNDAHGGLSAKTCNAEVARRGQYAGCSAPEPGDHRARLCQPRSKRTSSCRGSPSLAFFPYRVQLRRAREVPTVETRIRRLPRTGRRCRSASPKCSASLARRVSASLTHERCRHPSLTG